MYNSLKELTKHPVFHYFAEISNIPRGSSNEKEISDFLVRFARERNLEVIQDAALNVIIKKPATPGYENVPTVIIQGHMDMVCEKNKGNNHDFNKDPLQLRIVGEMLYATDTTLGADNGVAVAYSLALLDSSNIPHPSLEVLITTEEETTMRGAHAVDPVHLEGKLLINVDSEEDRKLLVSSAGGVIVTQKIPIVWDNSPENAVTYNLSICGLQGGHSGISIDKGRGNAVKLLGRVLYDLSNEFSYFIQEINGGVKVNSIPREAQVMIQLHPDIVEKFFVKIEMWNRILKNELRISDPEINIILEPIETNVGKVFSKTTKEKAIAALMLIPNGVQSRSTEVEGLVESSTNLGVVNTYDTVIKYESETRSSIKSLKDSIINQAQIITGMLGGDLSTDSDYPEWPYRAESKLRNLFEEAYKEKYGTDIEIIAVHAGIECGILVDKIPDLDAISIGPDIFYVHTPNEHLSIPSTLENWEYFLYTLKKMKNYYW